MLDIAHIGSLHDLHEQSASVRMTLMMRATGDSLPLLVTPNLNRTNPHLTLAFAAGGRLQEQVVSLDVTRPRYGGRRYWLMCPVTGRRVRCLYLPPGKTEFACREVYGLSYRSQSENAFWRGVRQAQGIRAALGGDPSIYMPFPPRPRGMHRRRYEQLKNKAAAIEADA
ncbi:MAG TPA: hypothetical protein VGU45_11480, partial [Microvirga sp.]|nr:hypothetical protein [Microvirga sp.]